MSTSRLLQNCCSDPLVKPVSQFVGRFPVDVVLVIRVEMKFVDLVLSATPDNFSAKAHCKSRLVINAGALTSKIGNYEFGIPDFCDDLVRNFVIVLFPVYSDWFESGIRYCGFNTAVVRLLRFY